MRRLLLFVGFLLMMSGWAQAQDKASKNQVSTWEELRSRPYPKWFKDAKLGIFIHWGVYSVPSYARKEGYAEWFLKGFMDGDTSRITFIKKNYGEETEYKDLAKYFKAELWDPQEWAKIFKDSGAKYVLLVTKHHDGYCLWPSKYQPGWNSVDVGPHRNIVEELTTAVRNEGMEMGFYYSLPEWNNPLHYWYKDDPRTIGKYVNDYMIPQFKELVGKYKPSVIFTDGEWWNTSKEWHARELIDWYYKTVGPKAIVNDRWGSGSNIGFITPEYSAGIKASDRPWSEARGLGRSFALNRNEDLTSYMTAKELIQLFVSAVSNGGGLTLNVGPRADGQIPLLQQERLKQLGQFIKTNSEAIYASSPWIRSHEERPIQKQRIDSIMHFDWVRNAPMKDLKVDNFQIEWEGYITPEFTEKYLFEAEADDGMQLWINDQLVIDKSEHKDDAQGNVMGNKTAKNSGGEIKLKKGNKYKIKINYYETKQNASISLFWSSKSQKKEIVPANDLFTDESLSQNGLIGTYYSTEDYLFYTTNNNSLYITLLNWPGKQLELPIEKPKEGTEISLLGCSKDVRWEYKNGRVVIDVSDIYVNDLPTPFGWTFKIKEYLDK